MAQRTAGEVQEVDTARQAREETEALHSALRNIAEAVINDADVAVGDEEDAEEGGHVTRSRSPAIRATSVSPSRSKSPYARLRSPNRSPSPHARSRSVLFDILRSDPAVTGLSPFHYFP